MSRTGRNRAAEARMLVSVLLLGAAVRLLGLGNQDLWGDEAFSVVTALGPIRALLSSLSSGEPHPPLYPLLLAAWVRAFGHSELIVRLPSAFVGIASVAVAASFARAWAPEKPGRGAYLAPAIGGILVALNPFQVWYAQEARMYAQVSFGAGLAGLALLRLWQGRRGAIPLYTLSLVGTMGSHYFGLFIPLAHAVALGIDFLGDRGAARSRIRRWLQACSLAAVLYVPWVIYAQRVFRGYYGAQPGTVDLLSIAESAWVRLAAGWSVDWSLAVLAAAVLSSFALLGLLLPAQHPRERFARTLLGCWLLTPFLAGFLVSTVRPMYAERYLIVSSLPLILLIARALSRLIITPRRIVSSASGAAWAGSPGVRRMLPAVGALGLLAAVALAVGPLLNVWAGRYVKSTYNTHVRDVAALIRPGDAVILDGTSQLPLYTYYLPAPWPTYPLPRQLPLNPAAVTEELTNLTGQHRGAWIFLYATADYDPSYLIPRWLTANTYRAFDNWAVSGRLQYYRFAAESDLTRQETAIHFGRQLALTAYAWLDSPYAAGDTVPIALTWQATGASSERPRVTLRLEDREGFTWAQTDPYIGGDFETSLPGADGRPFVDRHGLQIPPGTPPGRYRLRMSVYESGSAQPLEATGSGVDLAPGGVILATVSVVRPSKGFWADGLAGFQSLNATMTGGLGLLGFAGSDQVTAGASGYLTLVWKAGNSRIGADRLRIDLVGADGVTAQSRDLALATADFPPASWRPGDVVRAQYRLPISQRLAPGTYRLRVQPLDPAGEDGAAGSGQALGSITVLPGPTPVPAPQPNQVRRDRFGDQIELTGYDRSTTAPQPGEPLHLTLYWRDLAPLDRDYTVFVHLLDSAEKVVAQRDQQPSGGQRPTSAWFPGDVIVDHYDLAVPSDLTAGRYSLEIGLYDAASGARLPVTVDGKPEGDRVILEQIEVGR